jgi:hypothetical protein
VFIDSRAESLTNGENLCTRKVGVEPVLPQSAMSCAEHPQLDNNLFTNSGVVAAPYFFIKRAR